MKLSARNILPGTVREVTFGQTTAHIRIELDGGAIVTASITNESARELDLRPGAKASAVIKASDVIVGVPD